MFVALTSLASPLLLAGYPVELHGQCPILTDEQCPALLFTTSKWTSGGQDSHLRIAYFEGGTVRYSEILSAKYINSVNQLDRTKFLINTSEGRFQDQRYVIDLSTGLLALISEDTYLHFLRSELKRGSAMLVRGHTSMPPVELYELNLDTFELTKRYDIPTAKDPEQFKGIGPHMRISPNFQHVAYASPPKIMQVGRSHLYVLKVLKLATMTVTDLDPGVRTEQHMFSSIGTAPPAFEWRNDQELIYQHVPPLEKMEGKPQLMRKHILKKTNIRSGEASTLLEHEAGLPIGGNGLKTHPLTGQLILSMSHMKEPVWIIDPDLQILRPVDTPYRFEQSHRPSRFKVFHDQALFHEGSGSVKGAGHVSHLSKHLAYAVSTPRSRGRSRSRILLKLQNQPEPIELNVEGTSNCNVVSWIEAEP